MLTFFKHVSKQIKFNKAFSDTLSLSKSGNKEEAFFKLKELLHKQPANPYLRHHIIVLGEQLNKPVSLPEIHAHSQNIYKP